MKEEHSEVRFRVPFSQIPNAIFEADLKTHEKLTYIYLCRCGNQGAIAFPSYATIAEKCSISRMSAINAVKKLIACGLLEKDVRVEADGHHRTNIYTVNDKLWGSQPGLPPSTPPIVNQADHPSQPGLPYSQPGLPYKEPTKEEPIDKEQQQAVVVLSASYQQVTGKKKDLSPLVSEYGADKVKQAIEYLKARKDKVTNPYGFIAQALKDGWGITPPAKYDAAAETREYLKKLTGEE